MRASHDSRSAVTRFCRASRSVPTMARPSSSRTTVAADATTDRTSRSGASLPALRAATARSFHRRQVHAGQELLGHGEQRVGRDLGASLGPGPCVLLLDGVAHGGDPTAQQLLGYGELFGTQLGERSVAVGGHGLQTAGTLRALGPGRTRACPSRTRSGRSGPLFGRAPRSGRGARSRHDRAGCPASRPASPGAACVRVGVAPRLATGRRAVRAVAPWGRAPSRSAAPRTIAAAVLLAPPTSGYEDHRHPAGSVVAARADDLDAGHLLGTRHRPWGPAPTSRRCRRARIRLRPAGRRRPWRRSGSRVASSEPCGWRAPGARQVQVPSSRLLVSSMSILRVMRVGPRYRRHRHGENPSWVSSGAPLRCVSVEVLRIRANRARDPWAYP